MFNHILIVPLCVCVSVCDVCGRITVWEEGFQDGHITVWGWGNVSLSNCRLVSRACCEQEWHCGGDYWLDGGGGGGGGGGRVRWWW